ncbi:MAG TPA: carbonic anhydrase family protein [Nitrosospira sp.]|jgi:carbonic anhydrase|nr:carbonic anhydrase family protein [Nitrosospira sp.]
MKKSLPRLMQRTTIVSALFVFWVQAAQAETLETLESQSPINITSDNTYYGKLPSLDFDLSRDTSLSVINTGSPDHEKTIRADVGVGEGTLTVSGRTWDLAQFHFHTPSEHLINGRASPMEMHLVFTDDDDLLVVGRQIERGLFDNYRLSSIFNHLPENPGETLDVDHFNLNSLVPDYLGSFRYSGSLTTPPFSEGVSWVELAKPLYLSDKQIDAFESLFPEGNTREVQDLNGRIVLTDVWGFPDAHDSHDHILDPLIPLLDGQLAVKAQVSDAVAASVPEPETYAMLLAGLSLIGFIARRRAI